LCVLLMNLKTKTTSRKDTYPEKTTNSIVILYDTK